MHTSHEALRIASEFFNLSLPTTEKELKSAFRKEAKKLHTDTSGEDSKEAFIKMKTAYDTLLELPGVFVEGEGQKVLATVDGTPLTELGLGLGPTVNGTDCHGCDRKGYTESFGLAYKVCEKCDEYGLVSKIYPCRPCRGTGKFTQRRSLRVVDCRVCKGTGNFHHPFQTMPCLECRGTKTIYTENKRQVFYKKCYICNGSGEIAMWNPVLPKGLLMR